MSEKVRPTLDAKATRAVGIGCAGVLSLFLVVLFVAFLFDAAADSSNRKPPQPPLEPGATALRSPSVEEVAVFKSEMARFFDVMKSCDEAVLAAEKSLQKRDAYIAYAATSEAQRACADVSTSLADFRFTGLSEPRTTALAAITTPCSAAYAGSARHMSYAKVVLDGDTRPSAFASVEDAQAEAGTLLIACMAGIVPAAHAAGFDGWSVMPK